MRAFAPWAFAALLIGVLLSQIPPAEIALALREADVPLCGSVFVLGTSIWFLLESAAYAYLFPRLGVRLSWREARSVRGMTYLLAPIHWNVGKAAIVLRLRTLRGLPLLEGTSAIVLYQLMSMTALALLATAGLVLLPLTDSAPEAAAVLSSISPALPLAFAIGSALVCLVLRTRKPDFALLRRLRSLRLAHAFRTANPIDFVVLVAVKSLYHLVFAAVFFFGLRAFGVDLPFMLALIATPLIQAAGGLPITPAGLGTQQAAMLYFFSGRFGGNGTEAAVAAFGFTFPLFLMLLRAGIGLFYLGDLRDVRAVADPGPGEGEGEGEDKTCAKSSDTRSA